jgi:CspA family cold shock protein
MATGKVKFFNNKIGYGFITDNETGKDFVHISEFGADLYLFKENDEVTFDIIEDFRGIRAVNVKKL